MLHECYEKALEVLEKNITPKGFVAAKGSYATMVWARDTCISALGAELTADKKIIAGLVKSLNIFRQNQSRLGQIPNFVSGKRVDFGHSGAIDATLLYIIAVHGHYARSNDKKFLRKFLPSIKKAYSWLSYQDQNNFGLLDSQPGGDWMDASIQRAGKVFYVNILWYKALRCIEQLTKKRLGSQSTKQLINLLFWPCKEGLRKLPLARTSGGYAQAYSSAINPNRKHYIMAVSFEDFHDYFDTMANCMAILYGIADKKKAAAIINYAQTNKIASPYPAKSLHPVVTSPRIRDVAVDIRRPLHWKNLPHRYHNGGIWPFIGGYYVLALHKAGKKALAKQLLKKLAQANYLGKKRWEFNEVLHGRTGKPTGQPSQTWSAAMYIAAYKAVIEKEKVF